MKENRVNEQREEWIVELLTPKHAPQCSATFKVPEPDRRTSFRRSLRIVGVAAALLAGVFFAIKTLQPGEAYAAMTPQMVIDQAVDKMKEVRSFRVQMRLCVDNERDMLWLHPRGKMVEACYTHLWTGEGHVGRLELKGERPQVWIFTPNRFKVWSGGELLKERVIGDSPLPVGEWICLDKALENYFHDAGARTVMEERADDVVLSFSEKDASVGGEVLLAATFSRTDGLLHRVCIEVRNDGQAGTVLMDCHRFEYNVPVTECEMLSEL